MQDSETVQEGSELFQLIADSAPVLIWISDVDGLCYFFNHVWLEFTGRSMAQERGNGWLEAVHPDDVANCKDSYLAAFNARQKFTIEYRVLCADNQYRWVINNGVPRYNPDGSFAGFIGSCIDITERKQAELNQHNQEQLFKALIENTPDVIVRLDRNFRHLYVNPAITKSLGLLPEDIIGKTSAEVGIPEELSRPLEESVKRVFESGKEESYELAYDTSRGKRYYHIRQVPEFSADGKLISVMGISRDVTDISTVRAELAIQAQQQTIVTELGMLAISGIDLLELKQKAVVLIAQTLNLDYCSATTLQPDQNNVLIKAGYGWEEGIVGRATVAIEPGNWVESSLNAKEPIIIDNWSTETRFPPPVLISEHGIKSSLSIKLEGLNRQPYGTLVGHNVYSRSFTKNDINFFQSAGNVISAAIQRKQTEIALHKSEERFRLFQELTPDDFTVMPCIRNAQREIIDFTWDYINPVTEKRLGRSIEFLKGRRVLELYPTTKTSGLFDIYVNVIETGTPHEMETHYVGEGINNWFRNVVIKLGDGVAVTSLDITHTKLAEEERNILLERERTARQEAEAAQERLAFIVEASNVLNSSLDYKETLQSLANLVVPKLADWCTLHIADEDGIPHQVALAHVDPLKIEWALNLQKKMEESYPYNPDEVAGMPNVIRTGVAEIYPDITDELLLASTQDEELLALLREIGYSSLMIVPLLVRGRVLGVLQFVSTESAYHYTMKDLELAQELALRAAFAVDNARLYYEAQQAIVAHKEVGYLKDFFVSVAGHELRTPLTSIRGYAQIMQRNLTNINLENVNNETERRIIQKNKVYSDNIINQTGKMNELIKQLLDFSRMQNSQFDLNYQENVNFSDILTHVVEQQRIAHQDYMIITQIELEKVVGSCDEVRIEQVLNNLVSNAIKYSSSGSQVIVSLWSETNANSVPEVIFSIKDQGVGISEEDQMQVFDRFYRARSSKQKGIDGLGLGLYISHEIVIKHGGKMWLESQPGVGSTFYFSLPLAKP